MESVGILVHEKLVAVSPEYYLENLDFLLGRFRNRGIHLGRDSFKLGLERKRAFADLCCGFGVNLRWRWFAASSIHLRVSCPDDPKAYWKSFEPLAPVTEGVRVDVDEDETDFRASTPEAETARQAAIMEAIEKVSARVGLACVEVGCNGVGLGVRIRLRLRLRLRLRVCLCKLRRGPFR